MAEQLLIDRRVLDANGDPLSGAKLFAYTQGTTTLEAIYTASDLLTAHPSPLVSDSGGNFPPIWHTGDHGVKIKITDASDVEISWSPLDPCPATSSATTAGNISFIPTTNNPANELQTAVENASDKGRAILDKASNYTVLATDRTKVIRCTANLTLSLSAADVLGAGWFTQVLADGGDVTIDPDGSETIDGAATISIPDGMSAFIHCDGSTFYTTAIDKGRAILDKASNYTVLATDRTKVIRCTAALTLTLTAAATLGNGWFVDVIADGGAVTTSSGETIDGAAAVTIPDGMTARIHCDGTAFYTTAMPKYTTSLASSGYKIFPTGLILQWYQVTVDTGVNVTTALPTTFPNAVFGVVTNYLFTSGNASVGSSYVAQVRQQTVAQVILRNLGPANATFNVLAWGH